MNPILKIFAAFLTLLPISVSYAQPGSGPAAYRVIQTLRIGGPGGWDYVTADSENRCLYIPRGDHITILDLDTLSAKGTIPNTSSVHGVAIDPVSSHAFSSSRPVSMWDSLTLAPIKTIETQGGPDGILFEPATERIYVLSHRSPNITAIDGRNGAVVGTLDIGGEPEQAVSDGVGHVYVDVEDKDNIAVIDARSLTVTTHYSLGGKGAGPAGLALDAQNQVLFAFCRNPSTAIMLNATDGRIIATLPIGHGVDSASFNPGTKEAFSSQGDGTLTVIKENSPTEFALEQTVQTKSGARTSTLDSRTGHVILVTADRIPVPTVASASAAGPSPAGPRGRMQMVPDTFTVIVVGK